jgi:hypothetical protein
VAAIVLEAYIVVKFIYDLLFNGVHASIPGWAIPLQMLLAAMIFTSVSILLRRRPPKVAEYRRDDDVIVVPEVERSVAEEWCRMNPDGVWIEGQ